MLIRKEVRGMVQQLEIQNPMAFGNYDISNLNMITQNIQQDKNDFIGEVLAQIAQFRSDHLCVSYVVVYKSRRATTQKVASFE